MPPLLAAANGLEYNEGVKGWKVATLAALCLLQTACTTTDFFTCEDSSQCGGTDSPGTCELSGFCSFPDPECDSGQRYGGLAGSLSNACVNPQPTGTETSTETTTTTTATTPSASTGSESTSTSTTSEGSGSSSSNPTTTPITASATASSSSTGGGESSSTSTGGSLEEGLVGWWPLNDDPGDGVFDATLSGNDGVCFAACPELTAEGFYRFDGTQVAVIPGGDFNAPEFTISLWVRPVSVTATSFPTVFTKPVGTYLWNSWGLHFDGGFSDFEFVIGNPDENTATDIEDVDTENWHHYAGRFDGSTATLFADGAPVTATIIPPGYFVVDDNDVYLGGDFDEGGPPVARYAGDVADVRYYDRPLTDDEVAALAAKDLAP